MKNEPITELVLADEEAELLATMTTELELEDAAGGGTLELELDAGGGTTALEDDED